MDGAILVRCAKAVQKKMGIHQAEPPHFFIPLLCQMVPVHPFGCHNYLFKSKIMENSRSERELFKVAEIKVSYHPQVKASERPKVCCSREVHAVFHSYWDKDLLELQEQFVVMFLSRANKVVGLFEVSKGGTTGTVADPKVIFSAALKCSACGIILAHNHPSGNLKPSEADIRLTRKIKSGGQLLDVPVLDHLIVTSEGYYSFADEGIL